MSDNNDHWIGGDGGPLVVLQAGALPHWRGAADFLQSRMNGGSLETDYDVICDCKDHHLQRHGRDMLVLDDSEWSGRIFPIDHGGVVVEQPYYASEEFPDVMKQISTARPQRSFTITVEDDCLRLLVGADSAKGDTYGYRDVAIAPGPKRCDVYHFDNVLVIVITPV